MCPRVMYLQDLPPPAPSRWLEAAHSFPAHPTFCRKSRGISHVMWGGVGGLPQSCAADGGVSFDIEIALNTTQTFLQHDTLLSLKSGPMSCPQVLTQHVCQIPERSCSSHRTRMSCFHCGAADSHQYSPQMHTDSTFDLVAHPCKHFELEARCLRHLL